MRTPLKVGVARRRHLRQLEREFRHTARPVLEVAVAGVVADDALDVLERLPVRDARDEHVERQRLRAVEPAPYGGGTGVVRRGGEREVAAERIEQLLQVARRVAEARGRLRKRRRIERLAAVLCEA